MKGKIIQAVIFCAYISAVVVANFNCAFFFHQEREPEAVRELRKF
jgi:cyclic lactone autoinducer peptide